MSSPSSASSSLWPSSASQTSLCTVSEYSTNATVSDMPGPGRILGKVYSRSGRALTAGLGGVARRLRERRRRNSPVPATADPSPSNNAPADAQTSGVGRSYTLSIAPSLNETASDKTGAGRLLGNLYSAGGRTLEARLSALAIRAGGGPDACAERIRESLGQGATFESQRLSYLAHRDAKQLLILQGDSRLVREVVRLVGYARSPVPSTQKSALRHLATLAVEDPYLHSLFNSLDVPNILHELKLRELDKLSTDTDFFTPFYRKAIICLSTNEVNSIARKFRLNTETAYEVSYDAFQSLRKYLRDPEQSFLVLRHIRRMFKMCSSGASFIAPGLLSELMEELANLVYSLPHIVEWECLDDICEASLFSYLSSAFHGAIRSFDNILRWNKVIVTILRYAHRFPKSVAFLVLKTDIDSLLDERNGESVSSRGSAIAFPDGTRLPQMPFHAASIASQIIYDAYHADPEMHFGTQQVCKFDLFENMVVCYESRVLAPLWRNLSIGPDAVTSEILAERAGAWCRNYEMDRVPRSELLSLLCSRLASYLASSDNEIRSRAARRIKLVLQLDRYCNKAMLAALVEFNVAPLHTDIASLTRSAAPTLSLDQALDPGEFHSWVYRHRCADGRVHIRSLTLSPFSVRNPCHMCRAAGSWPSAASDDDDDPEPVLATDVFRAAARQLMLLEVRPGSALSVAGHRPVLASKGADAGKHEYLACVLVPLDREHEDVLPVAWTAVTDGATRATYIGLRDEVCSTDHFWVLVLRFDSSPRVERDVRAQGGVDVTGECRWQSLTSPPSR
ncbi:hypothetical protein M0805_000997 [Coniferiporia weirii]|nr:hypothetical protein M0805_000997 [Coniferiporia weirii]